MKNRTVNELIERYDYYADSVIFIDATSYDFDKASCEAFHIDEYINCKALQQKYKNHIVIKSNVSYEKDKKIVFITFTHKEEC